MTMNISENIRKIMGWCPNASALETNRVLITLPEDNEIPGEKIGINPAEMGWANKYRNYVLLMTLTSIAGFGLTALLIKYMLGMGFNQVIILKGILIGIILAMLTLFYEWRQLNRIDRLSIGLMRSIFLQTFLQLAVFFAVIMLLTFTVGRDDPLQFMLSLFFPLQWIHYPLVVYWERKNKKTIYLVEEKLLKWRPVALPGQA